jgi:hypothetical protein
MNAAVKKIAVLLEAEILGRDRRDLLVGLRRMNNAG